MVSKGSNETTIEQLKQIIQNRNRCCIHECWHL